jgi:dihydrofolate reductase
MQRPQCSVYIATSLDGFIARPNGSIDWLSRVERPGEDYGYHGFFDSIDTIVIGRKTYETALGFASWPYAGKRCVVLTHSRPPSDHGQTFFSGPPNVLMQSLSEAGSRRVYVDGGSVISQFLASELIDDVTVSIVPLLLGEGLRLTRDLGRDIGLELVQTRAFESGLVQLQYRVHPPGRAAAPAPV